MSGLMRSLTGQGQVTAPLNPPHNFAKAGFLASKLCKSLT